MNPLVLYGTGKNLAVAYKKYDFQGIMPVCLCDSDTTKQYQSIKIDDVVLETLPLKEVLSRYPNAVFFVTPNRPVKFEIMEQLIKDGIDKSRIINFEPYQLRRGCDQLEKNLVFEKEDIYFCCNGLNGVKAPSIPISDISNEQLFLSLKSLRKNAINDLKNGVENGYCTNCPEIKTSYFLDNEKINAIAFGTGFICQFKCCYCIDVSQSLEKRVSYINRVIDFIEYLKTWGDIDQSTEITIANGEITINSMQTAIIEVFRENPCAFLTNGKIYSTEIEKMLDKGRSMVNISLDSGTPETFELIKGISGFEDVCNNIRRYSQHGPTQMKYILIPGKNDSIADINGFLDIACETKSAVVLARDLFGGVNFDENIGAALSATAQFINGARERGLSVGIPSFFFNGQYKDKITAAAARM